LVACRPDAYSLRQGIEDDDLEQLIVLGRLEYESPPPDEP
jgi:hypothetical protein